VEASPKAVEEDAESEPKRAERMVRERRCEEMWAVACECWHGLQQPHAFNDRKVSILEIGCRERHIFCKVSLQRARDVLRNNIWYRVGDQKRDEARNEGKHKGERNKKSALSEQLCASESDEKNEDQSQDGHDLRAIA